MQPARITDGHFLESLVGGAVRLGVDGFAGPWLASSVDSCLYYSDLVGLEPNSQPNGTRIYCYPIYAAVILI